MPSWPMFFLVLALVLFILAGLNVNHPRASLGWFGLLSLTIWLAGSG